MLDIVERERIVRLHITRLPEGMYLATSDDIQGLVAQGRTVAETVEIARDVARKLNHPQPSRRYARRNVMSDFETSRR